MEGSRFKSEFVTRLNVRKVSVPGEWQFTKTPNEMRFTNTAIKP